MYKLRLLLRPLLGCLLAITAISAYASKSSTVTFESADGLKITADTYLAHPAKTTPLILLFHQAGSSRGEYNDIAPRLNKLGFNCIAVDLRSGGQSRGKDNETAMLAEKQKLYTNYDDALPDVIAAVNYVNKQYNLKPIVWGSSYSASLAIKVAGDHPELVKGVLAFSPGEFFRKLGKSGTWIADSAKLIKSPVFITSAKMETHKWSPIYDAIPGTKKWGFVPDTYGKHGSKALWKKSEDSEAYWEQVTKFLQQFKAKK